MIGTPGTPPNAALTYLQVGQRLNEEACPLDPRCIVIAPKMEPPIVDALKGLFQSAVQIREQYEKGMMGTGMGFDWYMDQNIRNQTFGLSGTGITVAGANQTGSNLNVAGGAVSTTIANAGDVFTLAGVNAINPQNKQNTGAARQFVVTANVVSSGTGTATIPIAPALQVVGAAAPYNPFATVTALPANGAALTWANTTAGTVSPQGLGFFEEAFAFAAADLQLPGGVDMAARVSDDQLGMSMRLVRAYDINQDRFPTRIDILYGWAMLYGEMACRIAA
jgi:hypothetical protein